MKVKKLLIIPMFAILLIGSFLGTSNIGADVIPRTCSFPSNLTSSCSNILSKTDPYTGTYLYSKVNTGVSTDSSNNIQVRTVKLYPDASSGNPIYKSAYSVINGSVYYMFSSFKYYNDYSELSYSVYKTDNDGRASVNAVSNSADTYTCSYSCTEYKQATDVVAY
ncbi:hypothetical protein [Salimicrobium flavidum]|uniref:Uncharacterized protein n=1 Tax=Salimicrobium flavidum TaxID=570947 RepID=A0A1N7J266_9BACI|nr:hypothetical protein [Salimicrobium flavidum]SIS43455.1 hypothetical protein SAMN05421687_103233 [Salimicrobium flavidum]